MLGYYLVVIIITTNSGDERRRRRGMMACCSKSVCNGCDYANQMREMKERLDRKCPFCRHRTPQTYKEINMDLMNRIEANDPVAIQQMGAQRHKEGDYKSAFEYLTKAAELGNIEALYDLTILYRDMQGVAKDKKKKLHHTEEAAIGGHPIAKCYLHWESSKRVGLRLKPSREE